MKALITKNIRVESQYFCEIERFILKIMNFDNKFKIFKEKGKISQKSVSGDGLHAR